MPVTAKLSRRFYEFFDEAVVNELVDWLNAVDATYRADLERLNELNFQRFDARVGERFAQSEAKVERRFAKFEAEVERRFAKSQAEVERRFALVERHLDALDGRLEQQAAQFDTKLEQTAARFDATLEQRTVTLIKWMFAFWIGTLAPLAGLLIALSG